MTKKSFTLQKRVRSKEIVFSLVVCVIAILVFHTEFVANQILKPMQNMIYHVDASIHACIDSGSLFYERVKFIFSDEIGNVLVKIREENQRLRSEISVLKKLEKENTELKKLLDVKNDDKHSIATAKVITIFANDFSRNCLINVGRDKLISADDIVFNQDGLIGRIIDVGENWSKVLLITDAGSNIPVKIGSQNINAIISGDNDSKLKIAIVHEDLQPEEGQLVVTSGYGEVFEEGMKVGTLIKQNEKLFVKPYVDFNSLKYLSVLRKHAVD